MPRFDVYDQHFLRSPRLVAELIGHSNIRKNDVVYDLGAGSGILTSVLARRCRAVVAVETEPKALAALHRNLDKRENVAIVKQDILKLTPPDEAYKIFANIPFSLSSKIVRRFAWASNPPRSMYLIVQKQFARKLLTGDDHFTSQLGAELAPFFAVRIRRPLKKTDFTPPPAIDTVLLEIKPRDKPLLASDQAVEYREFVEQCYTRQTFFAHVNKTCAGISAELRPSQLTLQQWLSLFAAKGVK